MATPASMARPNKGTTEITLQNQTNPWDVFPDTNDRGEVLLRDLTPEQAASRERDMWQDH